MRAARIDARHLRAAALAPPVSKSDAQRALVLARALQWPALRHAVERADPEPPSDVRVLAAGLDALESGAARIDCADGGAPFRFLLTQAAVTPGCRVQFFGSPRLGQRPHQPLLDALEGTFAAAGLRCTRGAPWPLEVVAGALAAEPVFRVQGEASSQFASSLVLGAVALARREQRPWAIELEGPVASADYLALTLDWAERCGVPVARAGQRLVVGPARAPGAVPGLPADWSSLGYLLLVAWKTGGRVRGVDFAAPHPDRAVLRHLAELGLNVEAGETVRVTGAARRGLCASAAETPDLMPTLAALACVLPGPSVFTELAVLAGKESDRRAGLAALAQAGGAAVQLEADTLTVTPSPRALGRFSFDAQGDHRMAMAAATLAVLQGRALELGEPECVAKSFPGFWRQLEAAGVGIAR